IDAIGIGAEAGGVLVGKGDGAPALIDHRKEVAIGLAGIVEIHSGEMSTCLDEILGHEGVLCGTAAAPGAAVQENGDRSIRPLRFIDLDFLDLGCTICEPYGFAEHLTRLLAVPSSALGDVRLIWRVDDLIVGVVEVLLVHVEPDEGIFDAWWSRQPLGRSRSASYRESACCRRSNQTPA